MLRAASPISCRFHVKFNIAVGLLSKKQESINNLMVASLNVKRKSAKSRIYCLLPFKSSRFCCFVCTTFIIYFLEIRWFDWKNTPAWISKCCSMFHSFNGRLCKFLMLLHWVSKKFRTWKLNYQPYTNIYQNYWLSRLNVTDSEEKKTVSYFRR